MCKIGNKNTLLQIHKKLTDCISTFNISIMDDVLVQENQDLFVSFLLYLLCSKPEQRTSKITISIVFFVIDNPGRIDTREQKWRFAAAAAEHSAFQHIPWEPC